MLRNTLRIAPHARLLVPCMFICPMAPRPRRHFAGTPQHVDENLKERAAVSDEIKKEQPHAGWKDSENLWIHEIGPSKVSKYPRSLSAIG